MFPQNIGRTVGGVCRLACGDIGAGERRSGLRLADPMRGCNKSENRLRGKEKREARPLSLYYYIAWESRKQGRSKLFVPFILCGRYFIKRFGRVRGNRAPLFPDARGEHAKEHLNA